MKRKLSLLMVLMMVLSLVPAMPSFAVGGDIVVARVANDLVVGGVTGGALAADPNPSLSTWLGNNSGGWAQFDVNKAPILTFDNSETVKGSNNRPITSKTVFNITIQDPDVATFLEGAYGNERNKPSTGTVNGLMSSEAAIKAINANGLADFHGDSVGVHVRRINPWTLEVVVDPDLVDGTVNSSGLFIQTFSIPMFIRSNGKGEVKVGFDHMLSGFRDYTRKLTIANIYSTYTVAVVDKVANIARNNLIVEDSSAKGRIKLIESTPNAWRSLAAEARRDGSNVDKIVIRLDDADYSFAERGFGGFMRTNPLPQTGGTYFEVDGFVRMGEVVLGTTTYTVSQNSNKEIVYVGTSPVVGGKVTVGTETYTVVGHDLFDSAGKPNRVVWKDNPIYGREITRTGAVYLDAKDDNRTVIVDLAQVSAFREYVAGSRNEITLDLPLLIKRGTPKESDVTVTLTGEVTPTSLVIAKYTDYNVKFTAEKVLDVVAGQDVQNKYMVKVFIEEMVPGSLLDGRVMSVRLTGMDKKDDKDVVEEHVAAYQYDGLVKLNKIKGTGDVNITLGDLQNDGGSGARTGVGKSATVNLDKAGIDIFDLEINRGSNLPDYWKDNARGEKLTNTAAKWELTFPIVVKAAYKGDLFLTFDGAGVSNQSVKIATVKAPITYEIEKADGGKLADLLIGKQHQDAPDVTITETEAGALQVVDIIRGYTAAYGFAGTEDKANDVIEWNGAIVNGKFAVTAGDAVIQAGANGTNRRGFRLAKKSTKATSFKATDVKVTLDRSVPYGPYEVNIFAGNVAERHGSGDKHVSRKHGEPARLSDIFDTAPYFNVVTPYPEDVNVKTVFTIGEKKYVQTIAGIEREIEMDVEAQISNDRTMLPMRYVAEAIGARVNYDRDSRIATFTKDNIVVSINIDSDTLYSNGSPVKLNAKPMNVNGRILLPLTNISQAFGLTNGNTDDDVNNDIEWDAAAKTVTLFGMKK